MSNASGPPPGDITVHVRTISGQTYAVSVSARGTVLDIKRRLEAEHGITINSQRLICGGRELMEDKEALPHAAIHDGHVVHLVVRAPGAGAGLGAALRRSSSGGGGAVIGGGVGGGVADREPLLPAARLADRVLHAFQLARTIKLFALLDVLFLLLWAMELYYVAAFVVLAVCGYVGALKYRAAWIGVYVVYLVAAMAVRVWWLARAADSFSVILLATALCVQMYILYLAVHFFRLCWQLTPADRDELGFLSASFDDDSLV